MFGIVMGCSASSIETDPNVMYGKGRPTIQSHSNNSNNDNNNESITHNGSISNEFVGNINKHTKNERNKNIQDDDKTSDRTTKVDRTIRGDLSQWSEAKHGRERRVKERQAKRDKMAQEMSERVMEEKERLSLVSSRSRITSRATSRATSPRHSRVNPPFPEQDHEDQSYSSGTEPTIVDADIPATDQNGTTHPPLDPPNENFCNNNNPITCSTEGQAPFGGNGGKTVTFTDERLNITATSI